MNRESSSVSAAALNSPGSGASREPPGGASSSAPAPGMIAIRDSRFTIHQAKPWHREPWPWILMAGPAVVLVAGAITLWLALSSADGLVADDYYRRGLAINQEIRRDNAAVSRGIAAEIRVEKGVLRVLLSGRAGDPPSLFVLLVHPTRAGYDERLRLARVGPGRYEAELPALPPGRWRAILEDPRREWRIVKEGL